MIELILFLFACVIALCIVLKDSEVNPDKEPDASDIWFENYRRENLLQMERICKEAELRLVLIKNCETQVGNYIELLKAIKGETNETN